MRVAVFSTQRFDREFLAPAAAAAGHELRLIEPRLTPETAPLAAGFPSVCLFPNDSATADVLRMLHASGTRLIALRSAGFNHVDLVEADRLGLCVLRVPAYSPYSVAEHTIGLILTLNRKLHRAFNRTREHNFSLDGLMGFDLHGRTAGVIGTGKIGAVVVRILRGFGCRVLASDVQKNAECVALGAEYVAPADLLSESDIVTLHCPLTPQTRHLIDAAALQRMRPGTMLINTSRGAIVDTPAVIAALKSRHLGYLGLDVYEEEADLFFRDLSESVIQDDVFARLLTFPNVVITAHQAFFTRDALGNIAATTVQNLSDFEQGRPSAEHRVTAERMIRG